MGNAQCATRPLSGAGICQQLRDEINSLEEYYGTLADDEIIDKAHTAARVLMLDEMLKVFSEEYERG